MIRGRLTMWTQGTRCLSSLVRTVRATLLVRTRLDGGASFYPGVYRGGL